MENTEHAIVREIIEDLTGRGGFDGAWSAIDEGIQAEIRAAWAAIVRKRLTDRGAAVVALIDAYGRDCDAVGAEDASDALSRTHLLEALGIERGR